MVALLDYCLLGLNVSGGELLFKGYCYCFRCQCLEFYLLLISNQVALLVIQSEVLGQLTDYFVIESPSSNDTRNAYLYAMGLVLLSLTLMCIDALSFQQGYKLGMLTKTLMSSAIYQKVSHHTLTSLSFTYICLDTHFESDHHRSINSGSCSQFSF